jgi:hypothetical protein
MLYNFPPPRQRGQGGPATPVTQRLPAITRNRFSLIRVRSPLLAESLLLSLPAGTEMFHFPALPSTALCIQTGTTAHDDRRVPPFGNPRINARLPAPRGLSQAPTSFIGSWCQDIHRVPLKTWLLHRCLDARVHCAVLKIRTETRPPRRIRAVRARARTSQLTPDTAAASSGPNSVLTQPRLPADVKACRVRVNNQCSTRKHGRRDSHALSGGAGAP